MSAEDPVPGWSVTVPPPARPVEPREPPTLSVVMTYYRGADTIADAVRSALAQTVTPLEIVICDDGSPDDLRAALGPLEGEVTIVRKQNGGTGSAMNAAIAEANGEYVVQLDQDDAFLPRRLEAIAAAVAARPDLDIVATDAVVEMAGEPLTTLSVINPYPGGDKRTAMLTTCTFLWPAMRRSRVLEIGGYDETFNAIEDWDCFLRLVLGGAAVAYVNEPLYRWRLTPESRSSRNRVAHFEDQVHLTEKALAGPGLSAGERSLAESLLTVRRRSLARERARSAVDARAPEARRRSLELLLGGGFDPATRAKAAVAVVSPGLARRALARRRAHADPRVEALALRGFPWPGAAA